MLKSKKNYAHEETCEYDEHAEKDTDANYENNETIKTMKINANYQNADQ